MTDALLSQRLAVALSRYGRDKYDRCNNQQIRELQESQPRCVGECACLSSVEWRKHADVVLTELGL